MSHFHLRTALFPMLAIGIVLWLAGSSWQTWQHEELGSTQLRTLALACASSPADFPPAKNLSWRVYLLPGLGEVDLYRKFRLDEPWDSPHNLALLPQMPAVFRVPESSAPAGWSATFLIDVRRFEGYSSKKKNRSPIPLIFQTTDEHAVPWTKPDEPYASTSQMTRRRQLIMRPGG